MPIKKLEPPPPPIRRKTYTTVSSILDLSGLPHPTQVMRANTHTPPYSHAPVFKHSCPLLLNPPFKNPGYAPAPPPPPYTTVSSILNLSGIPHSTQVMRANTHTPLYSHAPVFKHSCPPPPPPPPPILLRFYSSEFKRM